MVWGGLESLATGPSIQPLRFNQNTQKAIRFELLQMFMNTTWNGLTIDSTLPSHKRLRRVGQLRFTAFAIQAHLCQSTTTEWGDCVDSSTWCERIVVWFNVEFVLLANFIDQIKQTVCGNGAHAKPKPNCLHRLQKKNTILQPITS